MHKKPQSIYFSLFVISPLEIVEPPPPWELENIAGAEGVRGISGVTFEVLHRPKGGYFCICKDVVERTERK